MYNCSSTKCECNKICKLTLEKNEQLLRFIPEKYIEEIFEKINNNYKKHNE